MIINHNISSLFASRNSKINNIAQDKTMEKLSSGLRINRAADDAAGLAISEKMRAQIRGLQQAEKNIMDGISFIQTTEGYLENTQNILHRMRTLAVQSSNGIYTLEDRTQIQVEISQLVDEIDRLASHAQFNGINMLTGRFANTPPPQTIASMWIHLGANMDQRERLFIGTMTSKSLGVRNLATGDIISYSTPNQANAAIGTIDQALMLVSKQRADLGAYQNRLEYASSAVQIGHENLQASESRIRDVNMAEESIQFARNTILSQSSVAMLAHSNVRPNMVLQLIQ